MSQKQTCEAFPRCSYSCLCSGKSQALMLSPLPPNTSSQLPTSRRMDGFTFSSDWASLRGRHNQAPSLCQIYPTTARNERAPGNNVYDPLWSVTLSLETLLCWAQASPWKANDMARYFSRSGRLVQYAPGDDDGGVCVSVFLFPSGSGSARLFRQKFLVRTEA